MSMHVCSVSPAELFNLPLSEPHTVIHVSGPETFHEKHLVTATHVDKPASGPPPTLEELIDIIETVGLDFCPEVLDTVVICGDHLDTVSRILLMVSAECQKGNFHRGPFVTRLMSRCSTIITVSADMLPRIENEFPFLVETGPAKWELPPILPAMISPNLFLGSQTHAADPTTLNLLGIRAIANISSEVPNYFERADDTNQHIAYMRCFVEDEDAQDLSAAFLSSFEFISRHHAAGSKVLVHCSRGVSRFVSIVVNYLVSSGRFRDAPEALHYVQRCRTGARPNAGFMRQLLLRHPPSEP